MNTDRKLYDVTGTAVEATEACRYCGSLHVGMCPKVSAIDYYEDGSIKRVEFHAVQNASDATISPPETDAAFRSRILLNIGPHTVNSERVKTAIGSQLDEIAAYYGIERRGTL